MRWPVDPYLSLDFGKDSGDVAYGCHHLGGGISQDEQLIVPVREWFASSLVVKVLWIEQ
jgi:hypothetical protein